MNHALLLLSALLLSPAQSQPPSPALPKDAHSKKENRTTNKQQISPQNGPATQKTMVVNEYYANSNDRDKRQGDAKEDKSASKEWVDILLAISTVLLFVATVALCVVAYFQWQTMKGYEHALTTMASHMRRGLRVAIRQTRIANKSALAAKKSAEVSEMALKLTQRADILVDAIRLALDFKSLLITM